MAILHVDTGEKGDLAMWVPLASLGTRGLRHGCPRCLLKSKQKAPASEGRKPSRRVLPAASDQLSGARWMGTGWGNSTLKYFGREFLIS